MFNDLFNEYFYFFKIFYFKKARLLEYMRLKILGASNAT
jgi:hypothetical protein